VTAAGLLQAKLLVPIHYGDSEPSVYLEIDHPIDRLKRAAESVKLEVNGLGLGEWIQV
jgi:hypothetical protein